MSEIRIRRARLENTEAISALFKRRIGIWQRMNAQGQVEDRAYETLTIYERWLHGGPWMSVETGAIFLSHLLRGAGMPYIVEVDGSVLAYAEIYPGDEPPPFGRHFHIGHLVIAQDELRAGLIQYIIDQAGQSGCERVTVSLSSYDQDAAAFYRQYGLAPIAQIGRCNLSAQMGQGFYKAVDHIRANPAQIDGWHMSIGRTENARQHWETLWPRLWDAIDELASRRTHRLHFSGAGQEAFVCCQENLYDPRTVDVYCWSPKPLTGQLLTAISDWAHRQMYRTLTLTLPESSIKTLNLEAEATPYRQEIYAVDVAQIVL